MKTKIYICLVILFTGALNSYATTNSERFIKLSGFSDQGLHNGSRTINIALPADYDTSTDSCRVIYVFDGESISQESSTEESTGKIIFYHDELYAQGLIHPTIFVGIQNNGNRTAELTPTLAGRAPGEAGELESFYSFISQALKPYIDDTYRVLSKPEYTGVIGHSFGGLASAYLAYEHPETFGMTGCMSPSFWWDNQIMLTNFDRPFESIKPRFWIMSADVPYPNMWQDAHNASKILLENGWIEGENMAFHHVYGGYHDWNAVGAQMRHMIYFLLRIEKPELTGVKIATLYEESNNSRFEMDEGDEEVLYLELNHANEYRTNAIVPEFNVEDKNVVTVTDSIIGSIIAKANGLTTLSMSYNGFTVAKEILVGEDIYSTNIIVSKNISFSVYPNPTNGIIRIKSESMPALNQSYQIIDMHGRTVLQGRLESDLVDLTGLPQGVYSLLINLNEKWISQRVIME